MDDKRKSSHQPSLVDSLVNLHPAYRKLHPGTTDTYFDIARRAAMILERRSIGDIAHMQAFVESLLQQFSEETEDRILSIWAKYGGLSICRFSPVRALILIKEATRPNDPDNSLHPTWSELFASLSLSRFDDFLNAVTQQRAAPITADTHPTLVGQLPYGDAIEAITIAESMVNDSGTFSQIKQEITEALTNAKRRQTRAAAKSKHTATNALLKKLVIHHQKNAFESYTAAVEDFLIITPEEEYRHLAPTNRSRTLREGLSAVLNGKRTLT